MKAVRLFLLRALFFWLVFPLIGAPPNSVPPLATDTYFGTTVTDPDRWLEDGNNPAVRAWTDAQNAQADAYFAKLTDRPAIERRLRHLFATVSANYSGLHAARGVIFAFKFQPPSQQPVLVTMTTPRDLKTEKVVLDPNALDPTGGTTIDFAVPSHDAKRVAVSLSEKGSELGTLHFFDVATGREVGDVIPRVQAPTAGGSVAWNADNSGVFYTRYPAPGEREKEDLLFHQQVWFHRLGTPVAQDTYEVGRDFPRIAEIQLGTSDGGRYVLSTVANGDGGEFAHYLRMTDGQWKQVTRFEDRVRQIEFGRDPLYLEVPRDDSLYLLSHRDAPRGKIVRVELRNPDLSHAQEVIPQGKKVIEDFKVTANGLFLHEIDGGPSTLRYWDMFAKATRARDTKDDEKDESKDEQKPDEEPADDANKDNENADKPETESDNAADTRDEGNGRSRRDRRQGDPREKVIPLRGTVAVSEMLIRRGDQLLFRTVSFTEPYAWSTWDAADSRINPTELRGKSPVPFADVEVVREFATSKDGTKVPMNIVRKKGTRLTGDLPTILYGYGGFGANQTPNFDFTRRIWLDHGGVYVIANLRGGAEYGEEWHDAGRLTKKQNVFDDFVACARWLITNNYTRPSRLAIQGGSNGGLLMGATLTQHPEMFRAVVSAVGIYDMLRVELDPNGAFNTTEFGSVKDPNQFRALHAYSPYHRVVPGTRYPGVFLYTGEHDGRVNPWQSRKMAARLQSATKSTEPVLLKVSSKSGHGLGTALEERINQLADVLSFLFDRLAVEYSPIDRGPWAGAVTPTSALVKAKLIEDDLRARLVLSKSPLLTSPAYSSGARSESNQYDLVSFPLNNLKPDTQYYYALEVNGRIDRRKRGAFRTFPPPGQASFNFAWGSCARTGSTNSVFDAIRIHHPLFFLNLGDFHYLDLTNSETARFIAAYDQVLASPQQADLYRSTPFVYVWDDHDFGGNNSSRKATSHDSVRQAYGLYVPHYPLAADDGPIYQSFDVGRVKFIVTDLRSERDEPKVKDDADKSLMGPKQKQWFKEQLLAANGKYPLIVWGSSVPWLGQWSSNYYRINTNQFGFIHQTNMIPAPLRTNRTERAGRGGGGRRGGGGGREREREYPGDQDHWSVFSTERREIADFVKSNNIRGLCIIHGDAHMLGADDGRNADFATGGGAPIPVMCGAPLDQNASLKGGPYSQGVYRVRPDEGCFGLMTITDRGSRIDVRYSGRNNRNEEKVFLNFSVPAGKAANGSKRGG